MDRHRPGIAAPLITLAHALGLGQLNPGGVTRKPGTGKRRFSFFDKKKWDKTLPWYGRLIDPQTMIPKAPSRRDRHRAAARLLHLAEHRRNQERSRVRIEAELDRRDQAARRRHDALVRRYGPEYGHRERGR